MGKAKSWGPLHSVTLHSYLIGETEVTQALWEAVMGNNPSNNIGGDLPVENVSWQDCQKFIHKLNQTTGISFRLPTEAEWEYAACGGNAREIYQYAGNDSIDVVAWNLYNSNRKTHPVATKQPNALGLYDMTGNVWEWCNDWYDSYTDKEQIDPHGPIGGSEIILRGGSWSSKDWYCRVWTRRHIKPDCRHIIYGLRLAVSEGHLDVSSMPSGASIKIDGEEYGHTPYYITNLSEGKHTIVVSMDGFAKESREVQIRSNQKTEMYIELNDSREVKVSSDNPKAHIYIDDTDMGLTPYSGKLTFGSHTLYAKRLLKKTSPIIINVIDDGNGNKNSVEYNLNFNN